MQLKSVFSWDIVMRLGLDIGTNSIGWWLYKTNSEDEVISHLDGGVRLYGDGRNPKVPSSIDSRFHYTIYE